MRLRCPKEESELEADRFRPNGRAVAGRETESMKH